MEAWGWEDIIFAVFVGSFSLAAAWCDFRRRKIPNRLTVPMFVLGWLYQGYFFGGSGLLDGLAAFGVGFGVLFLLWMMGSSGGGDVKLMGALSVWLGLRMTILAVIFSSVLVLLGTFVLVGWNLMRGGFSRTRERFAGSADSPGDDLSRRRVMAFALPVALAVWVLMLLKLPPL